MYNDSFSAVIGGVVTIVEETDTENIPSPTSFDANTAKEAFTTEATILTQTLTLAVTSDVHIAWGCLIDIFTNAQTMTVRLKRDTTTLDSQVATGTGSNVLTNVWREYLDSSLTIGTYTYTITAECSFSGTSNQVASPKLHMVAVSV